METNSLFNDHKVTNMTRINDKTIQNPCQTIVSTETNNSNHKEPKTPLQTNENPPQKNSKQISLATKRHLPKPGPRTEGLPPPPIVSWDNLKPFFKNHIQKRTSSKKGLQPSLKLEIRYAHKIATISLEWDKTMMTTTGHQTRRKSPHLWP